MCFKAYFDNSQDIYIFCLDIISMLQDGNESKLNLESLRDLCTETICIYCSLLLEAHER